MASGQNSKALAPPHCAYMEISEQWSMDWRQLTYRKRSRMDLNKPKRDFSYLPQPIKSPPSKQDIIEVVLVTLNPDFPQEVRSDHELFPDAGVRIGTKIYKKAPSKSQFGVKQSLSS